LLALRLVGSKEGQVAREMELATTSRSHAIVSGSIGQSNLGDEALLAAFLERHRADYRSALVLRTGSSQSATATALSMPRLAIGWRFWWGVSDRIQKRRLILARTADGLREHVWLGGLLGHIVPHNKARYQELRWARRFCSRFLYYFGDVGDGFAQTPVARKLVRLLDRMDARIAVRSAEAAGILEEAGLRTKVQVGLDPVLYDRVMRWGIPFRRHAAATNTLAIIPCSYRPELFQPAWVAAARAAVRLGLQIRWISLCDSDDLPLCKRLAERVRAEYPNHPQDVCGGNSAAQAITDAACCMASRFHGGIFALSQGVPTLAVPYTYKVRRLFRLLGLEDCVVDPERMGESRLLDAEIEEKLRAAMAGHWRPDYIVLRQQAEAHTQVLRSLQLSHAPQLATNETPVAKAAS
jgi:polysaccharide pyruvyl transferase WcaK-like protein